MSNAQGFSNRPNPVSGQGPTADEAAGDNNEQPDAVETEESTAGEETAESSGTSQTETCNECGRTQEVSFPAHTDVAKQFRCVHCGAVNVARYPDNAQPGVEAEIQGRQFEEAILADEDQARRVSGDDAVDKALAARSQREEDAQKAANAESAGDEDTESDEDEEEDEGE